MTGGAYLSRGGVRLFVRSLVRLLASFGGAIGSAAFFVLRVEAGRYGSSGLRCELELARRVVLVAVLASDVWDSNRWLVTSSDGFVTRLSFPGLES